MGSAEQQFSLADILSQNYGLQGECEEALRPPEQLHKDVVSQVCGPGALLGERHGFPIWLNWSTCCRLCSDKSCLHICVLGAEVTRDRTDLALPSRGSREVDQWGGWTLSLPFSDWLQIPLCS